MQLQTDGWMGGWMFSWGLPIVCIAFVAFANKNKPAWHGWPQRPLLSANTLQSTFSDFPLQLGLCSLPLEAFPFCVRHHFGVALAAWELLGVIPGMMDALNYGWHIMSLQVAKGF